MSKDLLPNELPDRQLHVVLTVLVVGIFCAILYWVDLRLAESLDANQISKEWKFHATVIRSVLENLIAGAVAAIVLALTFRWIVAYIDPRDRVIEISPGNITSRLLKNAVLTRDYIFIGNTATFVSAAVLPVLCDSVRTTGHPRSVTLVLLDLMDKESVERYSAFKLGASQTASKVADQHLARWVPPLNAPIGESSEEIMAKVLSAIYFAAYSCLQSGMTVSVYLRKSFTPFRADMTDAEVVLTHESASESAVAFSSNGHFYGWYHKEADAQRMQGTKIDINGDREELRQLLLTNPSSARDDIKRAIVALVQHYAHLTPLASNTEVIDLAEKKVAHPSHTY